MKLLTGKKVLLSPMIESDFDYFMEVYLEQKKNYLYDMGTGEADKIKESFIRSFLEEVFFGWVIYTNHGSKASKIGVIFALDTSEHIVEINGALSKKALRGTLSRLRGKKDKRAYTYAEEALFLATQYFFVEKKKERVQSAIEHDNTLAIELTRKVGFKKEGTLRKFVKIKNKLEDIVMLSMTKDDFI